MRAILIMIPLVAWFTRRAKAKGRSQLLWGAIGAASYFLPTTFLGAALRWNILRRLRR
jgi:hypothetical protein